MGNPDLFLLDISRFLQQWRRSRTCHSQSQGKRTWPSCTLPSTKTCQLRQGRVGTTMPRKAGLLSSWSISGGVFPVQHLCFLGFALQCWKAAAAVLVTAAPGAATPACNRTGFGMSYRVRLCALTYCSVTASCRSRGMALASLQVFST